jgi:hypothetical protein
MGYNVAASIFKIFSRRILHHPKHFTTNNNNNNKKIINSPEELNWQRKRDLFNPISQFRVVSFNLLAPCYKRLATIDPHTGKRFRESTDKDKWADRAKKTVEFFRSQIFQEASIIGLQEYWLENDYVTLFKSDLSFYNYEIRHLQRLTPKQLKSLKNFP